MYQNLDTHIKTGLKHLETKLKKAKKCPLCNNIDFNIDDIITEWLFKPPRIYHLSDKEKRFITIELHKRFKIPDNILQIQIHHISYVYEITMPLCKDCHSKVHNSNDDFYNKFKPWDSIKDIGDT